MEGGSRDPSPALGHPSRTRYLKCKHSDGQLLLSAEQSPISHLHSPSYWKISPSCPEAPSSPCPPMAMGSIFFLFPSLCVVMHSPSLHLCLTPCPHPPVPSWGALPGRILCSHCTRASPALGSPPHEDGQWPKALDSRDGHFQQ